METVENAIILLKRIQHYKTVVQRNGRNVNYLVTARC